MKSEVDQHAIVSFRQFNRFYTRQLGLLNEHLLGTPFSLTQARVMYELANGQNLTASDLTNELGLDSGQLSRLLRDFDRQGLVSKKRSTADARQVFLGLTAKGRKAFRSLNLSSERQIGALLRKLEPDARKRLVTAMTGIEAVLTDEKGANSTFILRQPRAGDYGWVIQKNGEIYAREYGWNAEYEGLVAEIVAKFIMEYDPERERCWIAEKDGENVGCVFLVRKNRTTAKLRVLLVDPKARGLGLGGRLVHECTLFARQAGYKKITLWTNSVLNAARRLYEKEGYVLKERTPIQAFGHDLESQVWELDLSKAGVD